MATGKIATAVAGGDAAPLAGVRTATVTAVDAASGGVRVLMNGATVPNTSGYLNCLSSYLPRVGDVVALMRQDSSWLVLGATSRDTTFSRYTGGATVLTANAWNLLPFGTLAEGDGRYLTNDGSGTFTLGKAGVWTVEFTAITGTATGLTGALYGLFRDANTTLGLTYGEDLSGTLVSQTSGSVTRSILSNGATTVCAAVFPVSTGNPSITVLNQLPALVFRLNP